MTTPTSPAGPGSRAPGYSRGNLLVIDDDDEVRGLLVRLLRVTGHHVEEAVSAEDATEKLLTFLPDLILLDFQMPGRDGLEFLRELRTQPRFRMIPVVMLTGAATPARKVKAIEAGAVDFLAKPYSHVELTARVRSLLDLKRATDALEDAEKMIVALAQTIDARDAYTWGHSARVSVYAGLLGERIDLDDRSLAATRSGALFHDFGKIAVPDAVLLKPGKLTVEEYAVIQRHPGKGRELLQNMKTLADSLEVVHHHHERMDGSGYPDGLSGESIPITARVATIADVFDALTTKRVYREALPRQTALTIMADETLRGWWDGRLLDEFRGLLEKLPEDDPRITQFDAPPHP